MTFLFLFGNYSVLFAFFFFFFGHIQQTIHRMAMHKQWISYTAGKVRLRLTTGHIRDASMDAERMDERPPPVPDVHRSDISRYQWLTGRPGRRAQEKNPASWSLSSPLLVFIVVISLPLTCFFFVLLLLVHFFVFLVFFHPLPSSIYLVHNSVSSTLLLRSHTIDDPSVCSPLIITSTPLPTSPPASFVSFLLLFFFFLSLCILHPSACLPLYPLLSSLPPPCPPIQTGTSLGPPSRSSVTSFLLRMSETVRW